jgi:hypothetical protein
MNSLYNEKVINDQSNNIAIDFDGVIHNDNLGYHDGTIYGEIIDGAKDAIIDISKNYKIIIFTAKAKSDRPIVNEKSGKQLVEEWLQKHDLLKYITEVTAEKPRAFLYIDDKGYRFQNWNNTLFFLNNIDNGKI